MQRGRITHGAKSSWRAGAVRLGAIALAAACAMACARKATPQAPASTWASPVVRGADRGLELWWWIVTDPRADKRAAGDVSPTPAEPGDPPAPPVFSVIEPGTPIEKVLAPYLDRPTPFDDATRARWQAHGLRVVCVPLTELEKVQSSLRLTGPVHRQWFGEIADWTDVVRGPEFSSPKLVMVGERPEELRPGRLRLLARCWVYPVVESGGGAAGGAPAAGLRLELVAQYEPALTERSRLQLAVSREEAYQVFEELRASVALRPGGSGLVRTPGAVTSEHVDAIIIVSAEPGADWKRINAADPTPSGPDEEGPELDYPPTLGEAMLSVPPTRSATGVMPRARAVVILIPRVPERFELLGR